MHSKTFLLQSTEVSIDQFVIELWMSGSANLVCEIGKVWVVRRGIYGYSRTGEDDEFASLLSADERLRHVYIEKFHKSMLRWIIVTAKGQTLSAIERSSLHLGSCKSPVHSSS